MMITPSSNTPFWNRYPTFSQHFPEYDYSTPLEKWIDLFRKYSNQYTIANLLGSQKVSKVSKILEADLMNRSEMEVRRSYIVDFFMEVDKVPNSNLKRIIEKPDWFKPYLERELARFTAFKENAKKVKKVLLSEEPANQKEREKIKRCYAQSILERCHVHIQKAFDAQNDYYNKLVAPYNVLSKEAEYDILRRYFVNIGYLDTANCVTYKGIWFLIEAHGIENT